MAVDEPEKPGFLDRLRARFPWFDHVMRAQERYNDCNGNFYAAGITYFTIFALFPLLMVGFAAGILNVTRVVAQMNAASPPPPGSDLGPDVEDETDK